MVIAVTPWRGRSVGFLFKCFAKGRVQASFPAYHAPRRFHARGRPSANPKHKLIGQLFLYRAQDGYTGKQNTGSVVLKPMIRRAFEHAAFAALPLRDLVGMAHVRLSAAA